MNKNGYETAGISEGYDKIWVIWFDSLVIDTIH